MGYIDEAPTHRYQNVLNEGIKIYIPEPWELTLDLDSPSELYEYRERVLEVEKRSEYTFVQEREFKSTTPGHYHITVTVIKDGQLHHMGDFERIALQAILGSSYKREAWSLMRAGGDDPIPTALFQGKTTSGEKWTTVIDAPEDYNQAMMMSLNTIL